MYLYGGLLAVNTGRGERERERNKAKLHPAQNFPNTPNTHVVGSTQPPHNYVCGLVYRTCVENDPWCKWVLVDGNWNWSLSSPSGKNHNRGWRGRGGGEVERGGKREFGKARRVEERWEKRGELREGARSWGEGGTEGRRRRWSRNGVEYKSTASTSLLGNDRGGSIHISMAMLVPPIHTPHVHVSMFQSPFPVCSYMMLQSTRPLQKCTYS